MKLSIVIPTLDEEKYLPRLLKSRKKQKFKDYEIIVSDAGSKDKTIKIAKKFKCKVTKGGRPAKGRNMGGRAAKGKIIVFLDADVVLPNDFLKKNIAEFEKMNLDIAAPNIKILSNKKIDKIFAYAWNKWQNIIKNIDPHAAGFCIFSKKKIFNKIKGFDETISFTEDHNYARRAKKFGKFGILNGPKILMDPRRLDKEGRFVLAVKYILCGVHRTFLGEPRHNLFNYEFGKYK